MRSVSWNNDKVGVAAGPVRDGERTCRLATITGVAGGGDVVLTRAEVRELINHLETFASPDEVVPSLQRMRLDERAAVVKFLRDDAPDYLRPGEYARMIERGEHRR